MNLHASELLIVLIRLDGDTQQRIAIDDAVVDDYAEALTRGEVLPPIEVYKDDDGAHWLWDGFHRLAAYQQNLHTLIPANIQLGTRRDAVLASVGANADHGLRRSNLDKRRAVLTLLNDPEWATWSDRKISHLCGVSHPFVGKVRRANEAGVGGNGFHFPEGCITAAARVKHVKTIAETIILDDLERTPDLQKAATNALVEQRAKLERLEKYATVEAMLKERAMLGWSWPKTVENTGLERAYLKRLAQLADETPIDARVVVSITGGPAEQLHGVRVLESSGAALILLCTPGISLPVRRATLIAYQALKAAEDAGDYSLDWTRKDWFTPGALKILDRKVKAKAKKDAAEAAERAWLSKAVKMGVESAARLAGQQENATRLWDWLEREQRQNAELLTKRGPVRKALREQYRATGGELVACPDHPLLWQKTNSQCQDCYRTPTQIHERRAREKTAEFQEQQRLRKPMIEAGAWLKVVQDVEVQNRTTMEAGQLWQMKAIENGGYCLELLGTDDPLWFNIAATNQLLGSVLILTAAPTPAPEALPEASAPIDPPWWMGLTMLELVRLMRSGNELALTDVGVDLEGGPGDGWTPFRSAEEVRTHLAGLDAEVAIDERRAS